MSSTPADAVKAIMSIARVGGDRACLGGILSGPMLFDEAVSLSDRILGLVAEAHSLGAEEILIEPEEGGPDRWTLDNRRKPLRYDVRISLAEGRKLVGAVLDMVYDDIDIPWKGAGLYRRTRLDEGRFPFPAGVASVHMVNGRVGCGRCHSVLLYIEPSIEDPS